MACTPWNSRLVERVEATMCRALFLQVLQIVVALMSSPPSTGIRARGEAITPAITNKFLSQALLADLVGGAGLPIFASVVISSCGLDTAGPPSGLRASRVRRADWPFRPDVKKEPCSRSTTGCL